MEYTFILGDVELSYEMEIVIAHEAIKVDVVGISCEMLCVVDCACLSHYLT